MRIKVLGLCCLFGVLSALGLGFGCGDALVAGDYRGEPLFEFKGFIINHLGKLPDDGDSIRVAIAWIPNKEDPTLEEGVIDQNSISMTIRFPASLDINIFHPPSPDAYGDQADYAWGYVIVYEDHNNNRRFEPDELLGGSPNRGILYAPLEVAAENSPTGGILPKGFSLLYLPFSCGEERWSAEQECGVPIGGACSSSTDCNVASGGICLTSVHDIEFPGGYCTMRASSGVCEPKGGYPVWFPEMEDGYWFKTCDHTSDCRESEGYTCSITEGLCLPHFPVLIEINDELYFESFCYDYEEEDDFDENDHGR